MNKSEVKFFGVTYLLWLTIVFVAAACAPEQEYHPLTVADHIVMFSLFVVLLTGVALSTVAITGTSDHE